MAVKAGVTALERAFELARSGRLGTVADIIIALAKEGYRIEDLQGPSVRKKLRDLITASRKIVNPPA